MLVPGTTNSPRNKHRPLVTKCEERPGHTVIGKRAHGCLQIEHSGVSQLRHLECAIAGLGAHGGRSAAQVLMAKRQSAKHAWLIHEADR